MERLPERIVPLLFISVPLCQICPYPFSQPFSVFRFALPDYQHSPAFRFQCRYMFLIAFLVASDLLGPVSSVSPGCSVATFAGVTVPETSMHENYLPARAEHQVRFSGQILSVQSVTETHAVHYPAHGHFRPGVLTLDCTHGPAALLGSHCYDLPITVGSDSLCILALRVICVVRTVSEP